MKFILNPDRDVEVTTGIVYISRLGLDSRIPRQRRIDGEDNEGVKETQGQRDVARAKDGDSVVCSQILGKERNR